MTVVDLGCGTPTFLSPLVRFVGTYVRHVPGTVHASMHACMHIRTHTQTQAHTRTHSYSAFPEMKYIGIDLSRRLVASLNQDLAEAASADNHAGMAGERGGWWDRVVLKQGNVVLEELPRGDLVICVGLLAYLRLEDVWQVGNAWAFA